MSVHVPLSCRGLIVHRGLAGRRPCPECYVFTVCQLPRGSIVFTCTLRVDACGVRLTHRWHDAGAGELLGLGVCDPAVLQERGARVRSRHGRFIVSRYIQVVLALHLWHRYAGYQGAGKTAPRFGLGSVAWRASEPRLADDVTCVAFRPQARLGDACAVLASGSAGSADMLGLH